MMDTSHLTGLERAKLERSQSLPPPPLPSPVPPAPAPQPLRSPVLAPTPQAAAVAKPRMAPVPAPVPPRRAVPSPDGAHLHVGPGVKLKGEIAGCDTLQIEGTVEGNAIARQLVVCTGGSFNGTVEVEEADVEGKFEGTLDVAGRLYLRAAGRLCGRLSYGQLEVERGGEILGDVAVRNAKSQIRSAAPAAPAAKSPTAPPEPVKRPA